MSQKSHEIGSQLFSNRFLLIQHRLIRFGLIVLCRDASSPPREHRSIAQLTKKFQINIKRIHLRRNSTISSLNIVSITLVEFKVRC